VAVAGGCSRVVPSGVNITTSSPAGAPRLTWTTGTERLVRGASAATRMTGRPMNTTVSRSSTAWLLPSSNGVWTSWPSLAKAWIGRPAPPGSM